nr:putative ribonuclease H-like domain-containing protein [Tanacetum cinerariifolium]
MELYSWESRFRTFLDNKIEEGEIMWNLIQNGPYVRLMIPDLDGVENINVKDGESLESMYERLTTLMNIMDRNNVRPILVSNNTKFLNCLQPEWSKDVTMVRQNQTGEIVSYDMLYDSLVQFKPHFLASKAKKALKNHDLLALIAHSNASSSQSHANSSYSPQPYYVTHPSNQIIQCVPRTESTPIKANVQCYNWIEKFHYARDCQKPRVRNAKYFREQILLAMKDEAGRNLNNKENDFMLDTSYGEETIEELTAVVIEVNASSKVHKQMHHEKCKTIIQTSDDDQIDSNIIFDDPYVENNGGTSDHNLNAHNKYHKIQMLVYDVQREAKNKKMINNELKKLKMLLQKELETCKDQNWKELKEEIIVEVQEMLNIFESIEQKVNRKSSKENILQNEIDRLLEVSLTSEIQDFMLLSIEKQKYELLKDELVKSSSDSKDIQANLLKRIKILENDIKRSQAQSIDFELKLQHQKEKMACDVSGVKISRSVSIDSNKFETKDLNVCQTNASVSNSKIVNAVNDGSNIVCASCGKDMFLLSYEKCVARYDLSRNSNVKRALFNNPVAAKSKNLGANSVVAKSRLIVANTPKATNKNWVGKLSTIPSSFVSCDVACKQGKSKKPSLPSKLVPSTESKLKRLHMDLCGPMRVASINGKKYILVIVDDHSWYTLVNFLCTKDDTPDMIIDFVNQVQRNLKAQILTIQTDNETEFKNKRLQAFYAKLGIVHQTLIARTPQQNGVVEHRNRTLVEAAHTMLIIFKALEFLWAEAIATA